MRLHPARPARAMLPALALAVLLTGAPTAGNAADTSPSGASSAGAAAARPAKANRVEARIKSLHQQLKITPAQEPQWNAVAQVMRDNARTVSTLIHERAQKAASMTAPDDLRAYQTIADAHAAGIKALIPAFDALYATMSNEQKKNADAVFNRPPRHRPRQTSTKPG